VTIHPRDSSSPPSLSCPNRQRQALHSLSVVNPHEAMASVEAPSQSDASRYEKCRAVAKSYQAKFDIPPLASETLIQMRRAHYQENSSDLLLIDVRTEPERRVSQIPGSISLAESHDRLQAAAVSGNCNLTVVTYCTMGYRSGIEAKAIQVQYPDIAVFNLDGIVAYAYAVRKAREQGYGQMIEYPTAYLWFSMGNSTFGRDNSVL
jgi:rhodanese-related sulfurtransferase